MELLGSLTSLWKAYGLNQLPYAHRREIGGAYAMAAIAVVSILFASTQYLYFSTGDVLDLSQLRYVIHLPLVPAAFLAGIVTWRYLPAMLPQFSRVSGVFATVTAYLCSGLISMAILYTQGSGAGLIPAAAIANEFLYYYSQLIFLNFKYTVWVMLPLGVAVGYIHEYAHTQ